MFGLPVPQTDGGIVATIVGTLNAIASSAPGLLGGFVPDLPV